MIKKKIFFSIVAVITSFSIFTNTIQAEQNDFKDVTKGNPNYEIINEMRDQGIINGYPDGTFKPNTSITRRHVAVLFSRSLPLEKVREFKQFKDIPPTHPNFYEITEVQQAGIFDGGENGLFNPESPITRAQMAKVLVLAFNLKIKTAYDFPDVSTTHWSSEHVRALYSNGITVGDNGYYKPNNPVTRQHYAVFLHRAMNMSDDFVASPIEKPILPIVNKPIKEPVKEPVKEGATTSTVKKAEKILGKEYVVENIDGTGIVVRKNGNLEHFYNSDNGKHAYTIENKNERQNGFKIMKELGMPLSEKDFYFSIEKSISTDGSFTNKKVDVYVVGGYLSVTW